MAMPKQYALLAGQPMVERTLSALQRVKRLTATLVVLAPQDASFESLMPDYGGPADWLVRDGGPQGQRRSGRTAPHDRGYFRLEREWRGHDVIELDMEMPVRLVEAHPLIKDGVGKVAVQRGPLIYGFEALDNLGKAAVELGEDPRLQVGERADLLGGVRVVTGQDADGKPVMAVPFYAMANREKTAQEVWVRQRGMKPGDAWWEGRLYRPAHKITVRSVAPGPTQKDGR